MYLFAPIATAGHDVIAARARVAALLRKGDGAGRTLMHKAEVVTDFVDRDVQDDGIGVRFAGVGSASPPASKRVYASKGDDVV